MTIQSVSEQTQKTKTKKTHQNMLLKNILLFFLLNLYLLLSKVGAPKSKGPMKSHRTIQLFELILINNEWVHFYFFELSRETIYPRSTFDCRHHCNTIFVCISSRMKITTKLIYIGF